MKARSKWWLGLLLLIRHLTRQGLGPLFARGGGHFSPIGGYLSEADRVLVIDVNDSYQPWLVSPKRLFEAMDTVDPGSEAKRGLLLIESVHAIGAGQ